MSIMSIPDSAILNPNGNHRVSRSQEIMQPTRQLMLKSVTSPRWPGPLCRRDGHFWLDTDGKRNYKASRTSARASVSFQIRRYWHRAAPSSAGQGGNGGPRGWISSCHSTPDRQDFTLYHLLYSLARVWVGELSKAPQVPAPRWISLVLNVSLLRHLIPASLLPRTCIPLWALSLPYELAPVSIPHN